MTVNWGAFVAALASLAKVGKARLQNSAAKLPSIHFKALVADSVPRISPHYAAHAGGCGLTS